MRKTFCGWYFKCQSETQTIAVIPAIHGDSRSIQLITDNGAWCFTDNLDGNAFGKDGIKLNLHADGIEAVGEMRFSRLTPIKYDIMGPFKLVPFMECRHSVLSMRHRVDGELIINGESHGFDDALGYIEGDRGYSFPRKYAWTQSFFDDGSLMLSVADIPFLKLRFTGIICVILWQGKEYRLASYLGAKAEKIADGEIVISQGSYTFSAKLVEKNAHPLKAPVESSMVRTIHESAACKAYYRLQKDGETLFEFETDRASFEYEYGG